MIEKNGRAFVKRKRVPRRGRCFMATRFRRIGSTMISATTLSAGSAPRVT
jgi:hypothetical protein